MNILIIGSGSYVIQDPFGPGVVLRSVLQWCKTQGDKACNITLTYHSENTLGPKNKLIQDVMATLQVPSWVVVDFIHTSKIESALEFGNVAACFVAVPDKYHASYVELCARQQCPVWIVKPLTGNLSEAVELQSVCDQSETPVWIDYHKRFDPSNIFLKTKVHQQNLGRLLVYSVDYHQPYTLPLEVFDWTKDVDVFTYIGCHYVDQIFYLFPHAVAKFVSSSPVKGKVFAATGQFDGVLANITFEVDGHELCCPMNIGWFNPKGSPTKSLQRLKAQFEHGLVELDQTQRGVTVWDDSGVSEVNPYFFSEQLDFQGGTAVSGYGYESVKRFLDHIPHVGRTPMFGGLCPTIKEAVKTEYVLDGVRRSLEAGERHVFNR